MLTDMRLGKEFASWTVKGNVTNRSSHELSGFTCKMAVDLYHSGSAGKGEVFARVRITDAGVRRWGLEHVKRIVEAPSSKNVFAIGAMGLR
jgi:hypothetical protein